MDIDRSSTPTSAPGRAIPAVDPHQHGLATNAIGLLQSIVISVANSAPTAAMTVTFAALVVVAAGGGAIAILITMLPMLVIAYSFQRLNGGRQTAARSTFGSVGPSARASDF